MSEAKGNYRIKLRNNETGEIRYCRLGLDWGENTLWWLTEGNFGCDCNREWEFQRAAGEEDLTDDPPCGSTKYTLLAVLLDDGTILFTDPMEEEDL